MIKKFLSFNIILLLVILTSSPITVFGGAIKSTNQNLNSKLILDPNSIGKQVKILQVRKIAFEAYKKSFNTEVKFNQIFLQLLTQEGLMTADVLQSIHDVGKVLGKEFFEWFSLAMQHYRIFYENNPALKEEIKQVINDEIAPQLDGLEIKKIGGIYFAIDPRGNRYEIIDIEKAFGELPLPTNGNFVRHLVENIKAWQSFIIRENTDVSFYLTTPDFIHRSIFLFRGNSILVDEGTIVTMKKNPRISLTHTAAPLCGLAYSTYQNTNFLLHTPYADDLHYVFQKLKKILGHGSYRTPLFLSGFVDTYFGDEWEVFAILNDVSLNMIPNFYLMSQHIGSLRLHLIDNQLHDMESGATHWLSFGNPSGASFLKAA